MPQNLIRVYANMSRELKAEENAHSDLAADLGITEDELDEMREAGYYE